MIIRFKKKKIYLNTASQASLKNNCYIYLLINNNKNKLIE